MQNEALQAPVVGFTIPNVLVWIVSHDVQKDKYDLMGPYLKEDRAFAAEDIAAYMNDLDVLPEENAYIATEKLWRGERDVVPQEKKVPWMWNLILGSGGPAWDLVHNLGVNEQRYLWTVCERILPWEKPIIRMNGETLLETLERMGLLDRDDGRLRRLSYADDIMHSYITRQDAYDDVMAIINQNLVPEEQRVARGRDEELLDGSMFLWVQEGNEVVRLLTITRHAVTKDERSNSRDPTSEVTETFNSVEEGVEDEGESEDEGVGMGQ